MEELTMAVLLTAEQMRHTKASNPFQIKNPEQVVNKFTITEEAKAADTLKLSKQESIDDLKVFLKDYDMTSITTNELKKSAGGCMRIVSLMARRFICSYLALALLMRTASKLKPTSNTTQSLYLTKHWKITFRFLKAVPT